MCPSAIVLCWSVLDSDIAHSSTDRFKMYSEAQEYLSSDAVFTFSAPHQTWSEKFKLQLKGRRLSALI